MKAKNVELTSQIAHLIGGILQDGHRNDCLCKVSHLLHQEMPKGSSVSKKMIV